MFLKLIEVDFATKERWIIKSLFHSVYMVLLLFTRVDTACKFCGFCTSGHQAIHSILVVADLVQLSAKSATTIMEQTEYFVICKALEVLEHWISNSEIIESNIINFQQEDRRRRPCVITTSLYHVCHYYISIGWKDKQIVWLGIIL